MKGKQNLLDFLYNEEDFKLERYHQDFWDKAVYWFRVEDKETWDRINPKDIMISKDWHSGYYPKKNHVVITQEFKLNKPYWKSIVETINNLKYSSSRLAVKNTFKSVIKNLPEILNNDIEKDTKNYKRAKLEWELNNLLPNK